MITKEKLEAAVSGGCSTEGCGHKHDSTLYLHSRCHIDAPQFLWQRIDGIVAICVHPDCNKPVFATQPKETKLSEGSDFNPLFRQSCHPHSAIQLSYTKGTGIVAINCYECRNQVGEMVLE